MHQLEGMGWTVEDGDTGVPYLSGDRKNFRDVILRHDLREALRRINRVDGEPWLGDTRVGQAVHELERVASPSLMEANQDATRLLRKGTEVDGHPLGTAFICGSLHLQPILIEQSAHV